MKVGSATFSPYNKRPSSCSLCYTTFFGGNLDFPKIKKWKKFVLMSEPALKCENNASFKQINTLKLFIAFKMAYS